MLYFGISFLGFYSNELFYSFHLLDVIQKYPTLANVTKAITMNWEQLLMTFVLMLILMYIYTTITFFYIMETVYDYDINADDSDLTGENRCKSMIECFMTVVDIGLIAGGGIGDYTEQIHYTQETQKFGVKFIFDVSFFLIVKIILYNILFGIIIDTFAQLREQKNFMDSDKKNKCFICNFERFTFDKESEGGFTRHISKDHNLWYYVYYIVHLKSKDNTEYTGIESFVSYQFEIQNIGWMPR